MTVQAKTTLLALVFAVMGTTGGAEMRRALGRPDVTEVGPPVMISRDLLEREARRNKELKKFMELYGWPDYAEVQEVTVLEPLAAYEVRIFYIDRNHQLAFSRAHVSPALRDFGLRTFDGPIPQETLNRLLTVSGSDMR